MTSGLTVGRGFAPTTEDELRRVGDDLAVHHPHVPADQIRALVEKSAGQLLDAKITDFVPILVQHEVTVALRQR